MHISHFVCFGLWQCPAHTCSKQLTCPQSSSAFCWPGKTISLSLSHSPSPSSFAPKSTFCLRECRAVGLLVSPLWWSSAFQEGEGIKASLAHVLVSKHIHTHISPFPTQLSVHSCISSLPPDAHLSRMYEYRFLFIEGCLVFITGHFQPWPNPEISLVTIQ